MQWSLSRPIWNGNMQVKHNYLKIAGYSSRQQHLCECIYWKILTTSVGTIESGNKTAQMLLLLLILNQPKKLKSPPAAPWVAWGSGCHGDCSIYLSLERLHWHGAVWHRWAQFNISNNLFFIQKGPFVTGLNFHYKREYSHSHYWCHSRLLWALLENI